MESSDNVRGKGGNPERSSREVEALCFCGDADLDPGFVAVLIVVAAVVVAFVVDVATVAGVAVAVVAAVGEIEAGVVPALSVI